MASFLKDTGVYPQKLKPTAFYYVKQSVSRRGVFFIRRVVECVPLSIVLFSSLKKKEDGLCVRQNCTAQKTWFFVGGGYSHSAGGRGLPHQELVLDGVLGD